MTALAYCTVVGKFADLVVDGTDGGADPDAAPLTGQVTLSCDAHDAGDHPSTARLLLPTETPPRTITIEPFPVTLDGTGAFSVEVVATGQTGVTVPSVFTYTASFALKTAAGVKVRIPSFSFSAPAGTTVDLTNVAPVTASNGATYIPGPVGPQGPPGAGTSNDASTLTVGTLNAARLPDLSGTYAKLTAINGYSKTNLFAGPNVPTQNYTGMAADFSGTVADSGLIGGVFSRRSTDVNVTDGTNGTRGDAVTSTTANSTGSSQVMGDWLGMNHAAPGFVGKGSVIGYCVQARLGAHASGAYAEMGGVISQVINDRPGALVEAAELTVTVNQQSKASALTLLVVDDIGVSGLAAYNWHRGLWLLSAGTQRSGDALYVEGGAGWTNFALFKNTSGAQVFKMDNTGKMQVGAAGHTLYDSGAGTLKTDSVLEAPFVVIQGAGYAQIPSLRWITNVRTGHYWGSGDPNSVLTADVGSTYGRLDGGAGTTLYVKESGTNTNTGWVAK